MKLWSSFCACLFACAPMFHPAAASQATDEVGACLSDNTNGKDRKDLARWIFVSIAAHPEIKELSNVTPASSEQASRTVAALFSRLITESCATQIQSMVRSEGPDSLRIAFEFLGRVAMQELMTNPDVSRSMQQLQQYVDRGKMNQVLAPR